MSVCPQGKQSFSLYGFGSGQIVSVFGCGSWLASFRDGFGFYVQCHLARVAQKGLLWACRFTTTVGESASPCPTKRAPDAGESGAIPSLFLRLSLFPVGRRSAACPSAGNANRWAFPFKHKKEFK